MNSSNVQTVAIVGLGYVGLPLSRQFCRSGSQVIGLDVDSAKVDALNARESYIEHIPSAEIAEMVDSGRFRASTEFSECAEADAILICVPTPLSSHREPDISYVLATGKAIAPHLKSGSLVCLESTTYPGTTENELRNLLEQGSGKEAGKDFHLAYSPEREDPGNKASVETIPKLVGGYTDACRAKAEQVYSPVIAELVPVSSCRVAEASKLTENIFRSVNIAMVNELKVIFAAMGIDVWEVIEAASTKPFGFMPFYPGPGLGGHCIPIDPFYLTWKALEFGQTTRFIELAGEINTHMPEYVITRTAEALNSRSKAVRGSRILVVGLAYKPDVDDMRESPAFKLMDGLSQAGAAVSYYDPHIPVIGETREHAHWAGEESFQWKEDDLDKFDAVLIATAHAAVDYHAIAERADLIIDTRNAMSGVSTRPDQLWKA
jgi:UDP-N-acetyl-D-glucosamine dehydrogenase